MTASPNNWLDDSHLSYLIADSLVNAVGDPDSQRLKRRIMDILDRVSKLNDQIEVIRAGGNAEGFQIRGSDIDQMYVDKLTKVVSTIPNDIGKSVALLRMVKPFDVPKGYVKLIVLTPFTPLQHIREAATKISNEYFLSNEVFLRSFQRHLTKGVRHGPCMLEKDDFGTEHDRAFCFEYKDWPIYANEWVSRRRKYGWPSSDLVKNIMRNGCHLMAIGSKSQDYTEFKYSMPEENPQWREDPFQWRLSFSVAEKKLVYSFNDTQFLTFGILKLLNNEVFSKDPIMKNCLCSYFLKTLMFWTIEDTPSEYWKPERLVFCVEVCLKRLIEWLDIGFCPNYFVRENNMFQGKVRESELKFTSENISEIYKEGWRCLLRCHSLSYLKKCLEDARRTMPCMNQNEDFKSLTSSRRHVENEEKEEVHDIGVFSEINSMFVAIPGRDPLEKELRNSVTIEMTEDLDRADLDILRLRRYQNLCHLALIYLNLSLKKTTTRGKYILIKRALSYLNHARFADISKGNLTLATAHYCLGQFLQALDYISDYEEIINKDLGYLYLSIRYGLHTVGNYRTSFCGRGLSSLEKASLAVSYDFEVFSMMPLLPMELALEVCMVKKTEFRLFIPPKMYSIFLKILCYTQLCDHDKIEKMFPLMKSCLSTRYRRSEHLNYILIAVTALKLGKYEEAVQYYCLAHNSKRRLIRGHNDIAEYQSRTSVLFYIAFMLRILM